MEENNSAYSQPGVPQNSQSPQQSKINIFISLKAIIIGILLLLLAGAVSWYLVRSKTENFNKGSYSLNTTRGIPIVNEKTGKIYIYDIETNKMSLTPISGIATGYNGGASGFGEQGVSLSPDMTMSAVIDRDTKNLYIVTHNNQEAKKIVTLDTVEYITGWTKDSKYLLYFIGAFDWLSGESPEDTNRGFYLLDIASGESRKMEGIEYVHTLSNGKILIQDDTQMALYDIESGTKDNSLFLTNYEDGVFFHQIELTPDAKNWTFTLGDSNANNGLGTAEIHFAPIGQKAGQIAAKGNFAQVQFPQISPNSKKIAYIRDQATPVVYNLETMQEKVSTINGRPRWIDDQTVLLTNFFNTSEEFKSYTIWDLETDTYSENLATLLPKKAYDVVDTNPFPAEFKKRRSDIQKDISGQITIPKEFLDSYDTNLVGMSCNSFSNYEGKGWEYSAKYSDGSEHSKHILTDEAIITAIEQTNDLSAYDEANKASAYSTVCKLDDGRVYLERSVQFDAYSKPHAFIWENNELSHIALVEYTGEPIYSGCSILQITKSGEYYFRCGTGDGGYSAMEIQRIIPGTPAQVLLSCEFSAGGPSKCKEGSLKEIES